MIVGYAYVCGDIIHYGHLLHLKNCKALCDKLVVGVLTEKAIMEKKSKPVLSLEERIEMISAIRYVDVVVAQETYSPLDNAINLNVDILFESVSHPSKMLQEAKNKMKLFSKKVIIMPYYPNQSSTNIKQKILNES